MTVRYHTRTDSTIVPDYVCQNDGISNARPICQHLPGAALDTAVADLLLATLTPLALEVALTVTGELAAHAEHADALRAAHVTRAQHAADQARRRYLAVDPGNRLVADALEADWNARLRELAKSSGISVFLIGHVTKEGAIAGPRVLEHIVDTVLYLEGDRFQSYRLLRSVKNRFGATSEVGVFEMRERGMVEIVNPSEAFLAERMVNAPGSAIAVTMEGTRPLLVEIQGLTSPTSFGNPRRTPNGIDFNRLLLTVAVMTRRVGLRLGEQDVFVNVVSGLSISEPAADLAVAVAITSSMRNNPVRAETVLIGEVGLSGELRMVGQMPARLHEAEKLGFKQAIVPRRLRRGEPWPSDIQVVEVRSLRQARYCPDNTGHFGLGYEAYTHFTSPIRRYPDLLVHRAITAVLAAKQYKPKEKWVVLGDGHVRQ